MTASITNPPNSHIALQIIIDEFVHLLKLDDNNADKEISRLNSLLADTSFVQQDLYKQTINKVNSLLNLSDKRDYLPVKSLLNKIKTDSKNPKNTTSSDKNKYLPMMELNTRDIHPHEKHNFTSEDKCKLVEYLKNGIGKIPSSHEKNLSIIVDHLDSLLTIVGHGITLSGHETVSLCDLIKSKIALATALYAGDQEKFLLIQGDFYGIQDYIFAEGRKANKSAAKLLRGRSFIVSLYTELVALKVLEICGLPSTSQVMNAAGKFMIIAPDTKEVEEAIKSAKVEVNNWFWNNTYGVSGFGIATKKASLDDFKTSESFSELVKGLFAVLEEEKTHKFADKLGMPVHDVDYSNGVCKYNSYLPATTKEIEGNDKTGISRLSDQQITLGESLVKYDRILIATTEAAIRNEENKTIVILEDFIGYKIAFTQEKELTGVFSQQVRNEQILRFWDYSIPHHMSNDPKNEEGSLWNGFARRYINGYVAKVTGSTISEQNSTDKYNAIDEDERVKNDGTIKTWGYLACDDKRPDPNDEQTYIGQRALAVLKGDVDNLGAIFQQGIQDNNLSKMISLSRQINNFFAVYLPYLCATKYPNVYTVFAGGDDFFLVGSWKTIMELASTMADEFKKYVGENPEVHFSSGIMLFNDGTPIKTLANIAEHNLEQAKESGKNAVHVFGASCKWDTYKNLLEASNNIKDHDNSYEMSIGYLYGLLELCNMAQRSAKSPKDNMWRSYFKYRTHRLYGDKDEYKNLYSFLMNDVYTNIDEHKQAFKISLSHYLYQLRV